MVEIVKLPLPDDTLGYTKSDPLGCEPYLPLPLVKEVTEVPLDVVNPVEALVAEGGGITPSLPAPVMVYIDPQIVYCALPEDTMVTTSSETVVEASGSAEVVGTGETTPASPVEKKANVLPETVTLLASPLAMGEPVGRIMPYVPVDT
jgi:hypothetical protein